MDIPYLVLGPYVTRHDEAYHLDSKLFYTGYALEFSTQHLGSRMPVFRDVEWYNSFEFSNYLVPCSVVPIDIQHWSFQLKQHPSGEYVSLDAVIVGIYKLFKNLRPIQVFLEDFNSCLQVQNRGFIDKIGEFPFESVVEKAGFSICDLSSYGRRMMAEIAWIFPAARTERGTKTCITVGKIEFKPRPDKTLDRGKWIERGGNTVGSLLFEQLKAFAPSSPIDLIDDNSRRGLISQFEWHPLALKTTAEARAARIQFIKEHPNLLKDHKVLAQALKDAELYAAETTLHQICKFLPSLIAEAQRDST